jgi:hypothetical protein
MTWWPFTFALNFTGSSQRAQLALQPASIVRVTARLRRGTVVVAMRK